MFNNIYKNKYLRYTNSDSADDENDNDITESENNSRNIDLIVNKLENKLNENNNMKMTSQNQETTRTSKMNESNINNFPNLIQKNIRIKEYETSLDIGDSIYSVNSFSFNTLSICSAVIKLVKPSEHKKISSILFSTSKISIETFSEAPSAFINTFFCG